MGLPGGFLSDLHSLDTREGLTSAVLPGMISGDQNDMIDEVNRRKDAFKEQHPDATEEEIVESVQSQQIENDMIDEVNRRKDAFKEQHPDATEEEIVESVQSQQIEQLLEMQERYERRVKESEERAQQQFQEVKQRMPPPPPLQFPPPPPPQFPPPPPPPVVSPPPHVSPQNNDDLGDIGVD
ncbi:hypothetical protein ACLB2K_037368 [Fragaria x ananassa]